MKKRMLAVLMASAMMMALVLSSCGDSGDDPAQNSGGSTDGEVYTLRIGTGTGGRDKQVAWMEEYEKALEEATGGRIDVQCYPSGSIGTMAEMVQGVVDGTLDAGCFPTAYWSTIFPAASCTEMPGLFPGGGEQLWNILMTQDTLLEQEYINHGIIPGTWLLVPDRTIISSSKIDSIEDFQGKVIWCTPSDMLLKEIEMLGAVSSTINVGELAPSLQNGTVDGAASEITLYSSQSLQTAGGKYLLEAPGDAFISIFAISQHWWDKIPEDLQQIVLDVANDTATNFEVDYVKNQVAEAYEVMQEAGMEVVVPSEEFQADIDAALDGIADWYLETYPEAVDVYNDMVERVAADEAGGAESGG